MGELGLWYRIAPITFIGRSLIAPGGGQNPLEPARLGCAIATGPYTANFNDHMQLLRGAGGLIDAGNEKALATFVAAMLENPDQRRRLGEHAVAATRPLADLPGLTAEALLSLLPRS